MTEIDPADEEHVMRYKEIEKWADEYLDRVRAIAETRGMMQGLLQSEARGETRALRESVLAMCEVLEIPLNKRRLAKIAAADLVELRAMFNALRYKRALPG